MAIKMINLRNLPPIGKAVLALLPSLIIAVLAIFLLILPKHKEIKRLNAEITKQESEIAKDQTKVLKLVMLRLENDRLKRRLEELKLQLPEEKEVSGLLKQISDLSINSGLKIMSWKPEQRKDYRSGVVYEIPVSVELSGGYHSLVTLFSRLTKLNRIVNISDIKISEPKMMRDEAVLKITFKAITFSAMPEGEAGKAADTKKEKAKVKVKT
jgi:type IV pilus assembly protein PilO